MSETARDTPPGMRTTRDVSARGARVRFVELGSGPPLVLVHGYLWSRIVWDDVLPLLARRFRVIVPDLPGFGDSEKPSPARYAYGFEAFAESMVDLIASAGGSRVSVCGHGMGGAVAITLAANHPNLVDKLILVDPLVYPARRAAMASIATVPVLGPIVFKQIYGRLMFRAFFRENVYAPSAIVPTARIERLFELFNTPAAREAAYATMLATLDTRPLVASLPRVSAPTLVAWGRGDRSVPVAHGRRLARELRRARFEVFECGHSPPEECPEAFVDVAMAFLADAGGKAA
jgi:pimeloyl-ACP methyl ester carboxylesterase